MTQPPHPPSVDPTPGPAASEGSGPRTRALPLAVEPPGAEPVEATREVSLGDLIPLTPAATGRALLGRMPPMLRFGRYDLLGRLAYGGMAEIFLAREVQDDARGGGRFLVVKRVLPHVVEDARFVEMFVDESRLAMLLNHPNICHIYAAGEHDGALFLAMEWVDGMTLSRVIRRAKERGGVPVPIALRIIAQVAEALDYAHRTSDANGDPLGIVHRDVSPQNVMVAFEGPVKLLDFGIAKAASHSTRTEAGVVKGKFAYMAPQQCIGEPIDARADVFALGVCLHELLSGESPFRKPTDFETMRAVVHDPLPSLGHLLETRGLRPDVSHALETAIARATAKRAEERYQSAADLSLALEQVLSMHGVVVTSARISEFMGELFAHEVKVGPQLDTRLGAVPIRSRSSTGEVEAPSLSLPGATERLSVSTAVSDTATTGTLSAPPPRSNVGWVALAAGLGLCTLAGVVATWAVLAPSPVVPHVVAPAAASAPPEAQAAAGYATLYVESAPAGAEVELSGRGVIGRTPMEIALLPPGTQIVRLRADGFSPWERALPLRENERAHVSAELARLPADGARRPARAEEPVGATAPAAARDAAPRSGTPAESPSRSDRAPTRPAAPQAPRATGQLSLNTRPWSRVFVGSQLLGTTPIGGAEVPAGQVRLRLVDRDGVEHARVVTVAEGGHAREFFDLSAPSPAP